MDPELDFNKTNKNGPKSAWGPHRKEETHFKWGIALHHEVEWRHFNRDK